VGRCVQGYAAWYVPDAKTRRRVCRMVCTGCQDASKGVPHGMYRASRRVQGCAAWYVPGAKTRRRVCRMVCTGYRDASKGVPHGMYRVSRRVEGYAYMVCTGAVTLRAGSGGMDGRKVKRLAFTFLGVMFAVHRELCIWSFIG
jgi:hypothetical protein